MNATYPATTWGLCNLSMCECLKNGVALQNRHEIILQLLRVLGVSVPPFSWYRTKSTQSPGHPSCPSCAFSLHSWPVHLPHACFDAVVLHIVCENTFVSPLQALLSRFHLPCLDCFRCVVRAVILCKAAPAVLSLCAYLMNTKSKQ